MKRSSLILMCALMALTIPVAAQEGRGAGQGGGQGARRVPQPVNVRFELTITDQTDEGQPLKKSIMWVLADGHQSRVRSTGMVHRERKFGPGADGPTQSIIEPLFEVSLNVDAMVNLLEGDRMRSEVVIEYTPGIAGPIAPQGTVKPTPLNQSVTVILTSGKPLLITQAADPVSARKVTAEVTATILR